MEQSEQIRDLKAEVARLEEENRNLVSRNMQLSDQLCMWYEFRQRVNWLKNEMLNDMQRLKRADLTDDGELFAAIETRLEQNFDLLKGDFDASSVSELLGISQARLVKLFRNTTYRSCDDYLDFLRLMHAMQLLREHPEYGIAAVSEEAGFRSVRTFQRRMNEAVGMSPVEFRMMVEKGR